MVCRFVRPDQWSYEEKRPKPGAFKDKRGLTLWHERKLEENNATIHDLKFDHLEKFGEAYYRVEDFEIYAQKANERENGTLEVSLHWRPTTALGAWEQWNYAHIEMDEDASHDEALRVLRRKLSLNARRTKPPNSDA